MPSSTGVTQLGFNSPFIMTSHDQHPPVRQGARISFSLGFPSSLNVRTLKPGPEYQGRGRPPNPKKVPPPDLKYGQVVKYREGGEVADVKKRVIFGDKEEVLSVLKLGGNSINTSYIERNNLTARNGVSRLIRKNRFL